MIVREAGKPCSSIIADKYGRRIQRVLGSFLKTDLTKTSAPQANSRTITFGICQSQYVVWYAQKNTDGMLCASVPELDAASLKAMSRVRGSPVIGVGSVNFQ